MHAIIIFLVAAIAFAGYSVIGNLPGFNQYGDQNQASIISKLMGEIPECIKGIAPAQKIKSVATSYIPIKSTSAIQETVPVQPDPGFSVDTYIYSTFSNGEIFDETNEVTLKFKAMVSPEDTPGNIYFETKVLGYDQEWQRTSKDRVTFTLPYKSTEYIVLVRAGIGNVVDPTPDQKTFKISVSPYFGKVEFSSVKISHTDPTLLKLTTNIGSQGYIDITGWTIQIEDKESFIIPKGVEIYPTKDPIVSKDIIIRSGDKIYISGEDNPLGARDRNFRENKCTGYFTNVHDFPVSLSESCPKPNSDEITFFEPCCQKYINQMSTCEIPKYSDMEKYGLTEEYQCLDYLYSRFGYTGCFVRFSQDADFLKNTWHIFMGRNFSPPDTCYDLYLYDRNGLVVDKYYYGKTYCGKIKL